MWTGDPLFRMYIKSGGKNRNAAVGDAVGDPGHRPECGLPECVLLPCGLPDCGLWQWLWSAFWP